MTKNKTPRTGLQTSRGAHQKNQQPQHNLITLYGQDENPNIPSVGKEQGIVNSVQEIKTTACQPLAASSPSTITQESLCEDVRHPLDQGESVSIAPCSAEKKENYSTPYPEIAQKLHEKGLEPVPLEPGQKFPKIKNWNSIQLPVKWPSNEHGIGLRTGETVIGIDLDIYDQSMINEVVNWMFKDLDILIRIGQPPKALIPVICPEITSKILSEKYIDENGVINQIEILSNGQQFVAFGVHPGTGKPYEWNGDLLTHSLPVVDKKFIQEVIRYFQARAIEIGWLSVKKQERAKNVAASTPRQITGDEPGNVYNRSVSIETLLEHYGWTHFQGNYWTRPGKTKGVSGAVYGDIFWCFSTSTVLQGGSRKEDQCFYDAFELLTQYEFNGDKSVCASALRKEMQRAA